MSKPVLRILLASVHAWMIAQDFLQNFRLRLPHYGQTVVYSEVVLGRDLPARELEICWEIPVSPVKHRTQVGHILINGALSGCGLGTSNGRFRPSDNPVHHELGLDTKLRY
jgi:hypothetical protein